MKIFQDSSINNGYRSESFSLNNIQKVDKKEDYKENLNDAGFGFTCYTDNNIDYSELLDTVKGSYKLESISKDKMQFIGSSFLSKIDESKSYKILDGGNTVYFSDYDGNIYIFSMVNTNIIKSYFDLKIELK